MSDAIQKLRQMLTQAQKFASDAPLEAVARAKLVRRDALTLASRATGELREDFEALAAIAASRIEKYEAQFASWNASISERADEFVENEQEKLGEPIPPKI